MRLMEAGRAIFFAPGFLTDWNKQKTWKSTADKEDEESTDGPKEYSSWRQLMTQEDSRPGHAIRVYYDEDNEAEKNLYKDFLKPNVIEIYKLKTTAKKLNLATQKYNDLEIKTQLVEIQQNG